MKNDRLLEEAAVKDALAAEGISLEEVSDHLFILVGLGRQLGPGEILRAGVVLHLWGKILATEEPATSSAVRRSVFVNSVQEHGTKSKLAALVSTLQEAAQVVLTLEEDSILVVVVVSCRPEAEALLVERGPEFVPEIGVERKLVEVELLGSIKVHCALRKLQKGVILLLFGGLSSLLSCNIILIFTIVILVLLLLLLLLLGGLRLLGFLRFLRSLLFLLPLTLVGLASFVGAFVLLGFFRLLRFLAFLALFLRLSLSLRNALVVVYWKQLVRDAFYNDVFVCGETELPDGWSLLRSMFGRCSPSG